MIEDLSALACRFAAEAAAAAVASEYAVCLTQTAAGTAAQWADAAGKASRAAGARADAAETAAGAPELSSALTDTAAACLYKIPAEVAEAQATAFAQANAAPALSALFCSLATPGADLATPCRRVGAERAAKQTEAKPVEIALEGAHAAQLASLSQGQAQQPAEPQPHQPAPAQTQPRAQLLALLAQRAGKPVTEAHVAYTVISHAEGHQAQVKLARWLGGRSFAGSVCENEEAARRSAAEIAAACVRLRARNPEQAGPGHPGAVPGDLSTAAASDRALAPRLPVPKAHGRAHGAPALAQPAQPAKQIQHQRRSAYDKSRSRGQFETQQRKLWQDLTWTTGIPPPYFVTDAGHLSGYKVHVGDLPGSWKFGQRSEWVRRTLARANCSLPDDFGPALGTSDRFGTSQMLLTFQFSENAQRAQQILNGLPVDGKHSNARFWVPQRYSPNDSDPRFAFWW